MNETLSFIEKQFPVSKVSKESFKERKAVQSQTLTGLGKWWGRKPLFLVRATIIGCLMPASDNPQKDMEIFTKILAMDNRGLKARMIKAIPAAELYKIVSETKKLKSNLEKWFTLDGKKVVIADGFDRQEIQDKVFTSLSYDEKLKYCIRPEELHELPDTSWREINQHLGTQAHDLGELIEQLSMKRYGHVITVGDCFAGGGSIPFEAARIGANAYASDLNPNAGLLSWASLRFAKLSIHERTNLEEFRDKLYNYIDHEIMKKGIESSKNGDRGDAYLYCMETICPECNYTIPVSPTWLIGQGSKTVAQLQETSTQRYEILIKMNASNEELKEAKSSGTLRDGALCCPHCKKITPISAIRKDRKDEEGNILYGLREWEKHEFIYSDDDPFTERLYAIRYKTPEGKRYYQAPDEKDLQNEESIISELRENIINWQKEGYIPSSKIEHGYNTDQPIRERGWAYWHQLFNYRQLYILYLLNKGISELAQNIDEKIYGLLSLHRCCNWNSKLCSWGVGQARESMAQTFYNQAFNTMWNYAARGLSLMSGVLGLTLDKIPVGKKMTSTVKICDARDNDFTADYWITDPPYADAVNYHELSEFFLAWDKKIINESFPDWYTDSKRVLAVRGDEHFSDTMIEIYSNLANHMTEDGMQVVMFTHSDPAVWAQLAIIMWKAGLKVTAAWNIATETEAAGLKEGNYVKGTVLLVLRKQNGGDEAFLDEIDADIRSEVKKQIESMQNLDDKEEPNFSDPDYVLAAYAASLKVLTSYAEIEDLDLDYELNLAISNPSKSEVVKIIENAKKIAYDCVIPSEFESYLWKELSNSERFYIKGLESEKHGDYQISTYQEYARGFSIGGYSQLMANEKANTARLKTPYEMATRTMNDVPDFENSLMRILFTAIYVGVKEEMNPQKSLGYVKGELSNYWDKREMIKQILSFLVDCQDISNMQKHWSDSSKMAEMLLAAVSHDSI